MKNDKDLPKIEVTDSNYHNIQVVTGYMVISVPTIFEELTINVEETSEGDVYMYFDFSGSNSDVDKQAVLDYFEDLVEYQDRQESWLIVDDVLKEDLFSKYGTNGGWVP